MTPQANLGRFMQRFNTTYTVFYNRRYRRSGHLFQGRYKAILVEKDEYLLELNRYLHLHPVRLRKYSEAEVEEKRKLLKEYPWSSYAGYVQRRKWRPFVCYSQILSMVGGRDGLRNGRKYERFVMDGIGKDMNPIFWKEVRGQTVLGSDDFVNWVYRRFLSKEKMDQKELTGIRELQTGPSSVEEIAREVSRELGVPEEALFRPRGASQARSLLMELCRLYLTRKMSSAEVGHKLGGISPSALNQNKKRLEIKMRGDSSLRGTFQRLLNAVLPKQAR